MPQRFKQHIKGIAKCKLLHEALSLTGLEKWRVQFIPYPGISRQALQAVERWYICKLKTKHPDGYNMREGANSSLEEKARRSRHLASDRVSLKAQVRKRRQTGALLEAIASEFDMNTGTVSRWCKDIKVDLKAELKAQVRERRKAGALLETIVSEFDINLATVSRWCKDIKVLSLTETKVMGLLENGQVWRTSEILKHSKNSKRAVLNALKSLVKKGFIMKIKRGYYQKSGEGESCKDF